MPARNSRAWSAAVRAVAGEDRADAAAAALVVVSAALVVVSAVLVVVPVALVVVPAGLVDAPTPGRLVRCGTRFADSRSRLRC